MSVETAATGPVDQDDLGVVVAYDGSPEAQAAVRWAAHEAVSQSAPLDVVVVWHPGLLGRGSGADADEERAQRLAEEAATTAAAAVGGEPLEVRRHVERGSARSVLLDRARRGRMLVLGTGGHVGRLGAMLGSVSGHVVDRADVPVVLLGPHASAQDAEARILLVSRFGVADGGAVSWALERARTHPTCVLHLLDSYSPPGIGLGIVNDTVRRLARRQAELAHEHTLEELRQAAGNVPVTGALFEGKAADVEYVHGLPGDLLVLGAADVDQRPSLARVRCPVAVVPPLRAAGAGRSGVGTHLEGSALVDVGAPAPGEPR